MRLAALRDLPNECEPFVSAWNYHSGGLTPDELEHIEADAIMFKVTFKLPEPDYQDDLERHCDATETKSDRATVTGVNLGSGRRTGAGLSRQLVVS